MARITIKRPNGSMEYAELTTDRSLAGNDRLVVMKNGTTHYAKLDTGVSTHMYVVKKGRKLYVQKEVNKPKPTFTWELPSSNGWYGKNLVIPRTGVYEVEEYGGKKQYTFQKGDPLTEEHIYAENPEEEGFEYMCYFYIGKTLVDSLVDDTTSPRVTYLHD